MATQLGVDPLVGAEVRHPVALVRLGGGQRVLTCLKEGFHGTLVRHREAGHVIWLLRGALATWLLFKVLEDASEVIAVWLVNRKGFSVVGLALLDQVFVSRDIHRCSRPTLV